MLRMEREIEGLQKDLKQIEESYGTEMLNLVLARAYLLKLNPYRRSRLKGVSDWTGRVPL